MIREAEYNRKMHWTVEPCLEARREELWVDCAETGAKKRKVWHREKGEEERRLHVVRYLAEEPRGVVLLCHGFTESEPKYREISYYFLQEGYHVYMPEHCGHGLSYRLTEDPSLVHVDKWTRYVRDFLKVSGMAKREHPKLPVYLYAHSMGGAIGAAAAAQAPELYQKVVLSSPMLKPLTGNVPWGVTVSIAEVNTLLGRGKRYLTGQKPYDGTETFEESSGKSGARFERYQKLKKDHPELRTNAPSYGWMYQAARMSYYLREKAWRQIAAPVLLLQAGKDTLVSNEAQDKFAARINRYGRTTCYLTKFPESKHELFGSDDETLEKYWTAVFSFLSE